MKNVMGVCDFKFKGYVVEHKKISKKNHENLEIMVSGDTTVKEKRNKYTLRVTIWCNLKLQWLE